MLRPVPARWFEVLVALDDVAVTLEALAATGAVELEPRPADSAVVPMTELRAPLERYAELAQLYQAYWPAPAPHPPVLPSSPRAILARALARLEAWRASAEPAIRTLQALEHELAELAVWRELFARFRWSPIDFGLLAQADEVIAHRLYVFPEPVDLTLPPGVLTLGFALKREQALLVVGPSAAVEKLHRQASALKGRALDIPKWMHGRAADCLPLAQRRLNRVRHGIRRLRAVLDKLNAAHRLPEALADLERLRWFAEQVERLAAGEHFAWVTGWTSEPTGRRLHAALERARVRALIHFPPPPADANPPLVLCNPWWAQPFELFARALGVPGRHEVDPSRLLAFVVPLLFGYMFGDVGQGFVLFVAGLALARRFAVARLLVAGGLSAMGFGLLFGSVFAREDVLPALWLHPLDTPLLILGLPLLFGATLLAMGLALNGLEARWRAEGRRWLAADAGLLALYAGAILGLVHAPLFTVAGMGLAWYVLGHAMSRRTLAALLGALGHLLEQVLQLAINTLSFARVGAFALAHAGLSAAIVALAQASGHPVAAVAVMFVGNVIVIVLEGLVVSVQATRLVLFEFFIRFLRGGGRVFRPLPLPPSVQPGSLA